MSQSAEFEEAHPSYHRLPTMLKAGVLFNLAVCLAIILGTPHLEAYWDDLDMDLPAPTALVIDQTWLFVLLPVWAIVVSIILYTRARNDLSRSIAQGISVVIPLALCMFLAIASYLPNVTLLWISP